MIIKAINKIITKKKKGKQVMTKIKQKMNEKTKLLIFISNIFLISVLFFWISILKQNIRISYCYLENIAILVKLYSKLLRKLFEVERSGCFINKIFIELRSRQLQQLTIYIYIYIYIALEESPERTNKKYTKKSI